MVMICRNFVELHCLMLLAKVSRRFVKTFAIDGHCGHFGHVNLTFYTNFHSALLTTLHIKFVFDWPSGFRGDV